MSETEKQKSPHGRLIVGGLYLLAEEDGTFGVLKILAVDRGGVHLRLYANHYKRKPKDLNPAVLRLSRDGWLDGSSYGHLPVGKESFRRWPIEFVRQESVSEEELEGYQIWKEEGGGYF
ncbi:MAG: hypothetical protein GX444_13605 [Myxococcales bacterium]|nr:hypothetical protein [Myxococcales bacterium]